VLRYIFVVLLLLAHPSLAIEKPEHIKGIYVSSWVSGNTTFLDSLIKLANETEINTFVIDVKDATGKTYKHMNPRLATTLQKLHDNNIYVIARIVLFRDPVFVDMYPEEAITDSRTGQPWEHRGKKEWVSAYSEKAWYYNIIIAEEAMKLGFTEIQWDYIRLPDIPQSQRKHITYPGKQNQTRSEGVVGFLKYAKEHLPPVRMTADVFGYVAVNGGDLMIGQQWETLLPNISAIHPMTYPSHYHKGAFGYQNPNSVPYEITDNTIKAALKRSVGNEDKIIFWLQAFTMGKPAYTKHHIQQQIKALNDNGIYQYLLWNPRNRYNFY